MHRIDSVSAEPDTFGTGKDGYTEGDPSAGIPATATTDDWFNAVQEELCRPIEAFEGSLVKADNHQLMRVLRFITGRLAGANLTQVNATAATYYGIAVRERVPGGITPYVVAAGASGAILVSLNGSGGWYAPSAAGGYTGTFYGAAWSPTLSQWCLVGTGGEIQTAGSTASGWTKQTPAGGFSGTFRSVAWLEDTGLGTSYWIAVGDSGTIQTSADGVTWVARTAGSSYASTFRKVVCSENFAVAAGDNGEIQTSSNGVGWTRRINDAGSLTGVAYDSVQGHWVVVGNSTTIYRSSDGTTWGSVVTSRDNSLITSYEDIVWSPSFGWVLATTIGGGLGFALDLINPTTPKTHWPGDLNVGDYVYAGMTADHRNIFMTTTSNDGIYRSLAF